MGIDMRILLSQFMAVGMLVCTGAAGAAAQPQWPDNPSRLQLNTPYGDLHVSSSDYVYESRLMLDDHDVEPLVQGLLNIPYAFSSPGFHVALVSINTGDNGCPIVYKWIMLKKSGYSITPDFGSCSESIQVSAQGHVFTLKTPNAQNPDKVDTYIYDGKTVRQKNTR